MSFPVVFYSPHQQLAVLDILENPFSGRELGTWISVIKLNPRQVHLDLKSVFLMISTIIFLNFPWLLTSKGYPPFGLTLLTNYKGFYQSSDAEKQLKGDSTILSSVSASSIFTISIISWSCHVLYVHKPLTHNSLLISSTLSLCSWGHFTTRHLMPDSIVDLTVGKFSSQDISITNNISGLWHFSILPHLTWITTPSISLFACIIHSKYSKLVTWNSKILNF